MSDTPTPRTTAARRINHFDKSLPKYIVGVEVAEQLERELADRREWSSKLADTADDLRSELAETAKDYRCLAELLDGHDATECRANLVKLKSDLVAVIAAVLKRDGKDVTSMTAMDRIAELHANEQRIDAERALADRLANVLTLYNHDLLAGETIQWVPAHDEALAAWKGARK